MTDNSSLPLKGVRILDFSRILSGPYTTMILADMGAEVIKIEPIEKGDETRSFPPFLGELSHYFIALNRNKKSIAINLKSADGAEIARRLAAQSTVLVENFRHGVMDRLGLGYDRLAPLNPALIYCSITGFGSDSPLRDQPAFDLVVQALSGVMSINVDAGEAPRKLGLPIGDLAGSIFAVFGIQAALYRLKATGKGGKVEISMLDGLLGLLGYLSQIYFVTGQSPQPFGNRHPSLTPYGMFKTKDSHVIVACLTEVFWANLTRALERPDLLIDTRYSEYQARLTNRDSLEKTVSDCFAEQTTEYWLDRLRKFDVPHAPILSVAEAISQPHVTARQMIQTVPGLSGEEIKLMNSPIRFGGEPARDFKAPPTLGKEF
jgi:crotonobetainyl-CoA:carnitine CoA-transferase CaiB-like acyl-CoA transferase